MPPIELAGLPGTKLKPKPKDMFNPALRLLPGVEPEEQVLEKLFTMIRETESIILMPPPMIVSYEFGLYCTPEALKEIKEFIDKEDLWEKVAICFTGSILIPQEDEPRLVPVYGKLKKLGSKNLVLENAFYTGFDVDQFDPLKKKDMHEIGEISIPVPDIMARDIMHPSGEMLLPEAAWEHDKDFFVCIQKEHADKLGEVREIIEKFDTYIEVERETSKGNQILEGSCTKGALKDIIKQFKNKNYFEFLELQHSPRPKVEKPDVLAFIMFEEDQ